MITHDERRMRTCVKCAAAKPLTPESFRFRWQDGRLKITRSCKVCLYAERRGHAADPAFKERRRERSRSPEQRAKAKKYLARARRDPARQAAERAYKRSARYKAQQREYSKKRYASPEGRAWFAEYFQRRNRDPAFRARTREYDRQRKKNDPAVYLRITISSQMHAMFRSYLANGKGGRSWTALVGFSAQDLKQHLGSLFQPGMSWENKGEWEIDHIVPIAWWGLTSTEDQDFKRCWSLQNLQPLWAAENRRKVAYRATINGLTYTKGEWLAAGKPMAPSQEPR